MAYVIDVPPAYEIMANFSGQHMDLWGEMEMVGTIMDQDIEMVPCETIDLTVPAHAEIIIEGNVHLTGTARTGEITAPSMYFLPHYDNCPEFEVTAIMTRGTESLQTRRWRKPDSNPRSRSVIRELSGYTPSCSIR
jgi:4-hydroxy-3-polyprenylbenzoate decarboxylase